MLFTKLNTGYLTFIAHLIFTETVRDWETSTDGGTRGHRMSSLCSVDRLLKGWIWGEVCFIFVSTFTHQQYWLLSISVPFSIFQEEISSLKLLFHNLLPTPHVCCWWFRDIYLTKNEQCGKKYSGSLWGFLVAFQNLLSITVSSKSYLSVHILHWHIALLLYKGGVWYDGA